MLLLQKLLFSIHKMIATSGFLTAFRVHQIRFRPGLHPGARTPLGELTVLPQIPSWFNGDLLLRGRGGQGEGGEGKEGEGREGFTPPSLRKFLDPLLFITRFISGFLTVRYGTVNTNEQSS